MPQRLSDQERQGLLAEALTSAANAIFIADRSGRLLWVNDAFCRLSGYSSTEVIGRTPRFLKSGEQDEAFYRELWQTILAGNVWRGEVVERHKDGSLYAVDEVITPLRDAGGAVTHFLAVQNDITSHKRKIEREHFLAYHDALTGLPNRVLFLDAARRAIIHADTTGQQVAVLFLDLDNFKAINDTLGHAIGDELLTAATERLNAAVRKTDMVARISGDEFAILLIDLTQAQIASVAENVLARISQPFSIQSHHVRTTVSIGIACYPALAANAEELLSQADLAMYRVKRTGRNNYCFA